MRTLKVLAAHKDLCSIAETGKNNIALNSLTFLVITSAVVVGVSQVQRRASETLISIVSHCGIT